MKRSLLINFNNGDTPKELEIKKAATVKSANQFIYMELVDGEWKLTFSDSVIKDFSTVDNFKVVRED
jgi:hypothetical protein